jgi:hypothetical protein
LASIYSSPRQIGPSTPSDLRGRKA